MCGAAERRVSSLLARLERHRIDASQVALLPGFKKLLEKRKNGSSPKKRLDSKPDKDVWHWLNYGVNFNWMTRRCLGPPCIVALVSVIVGLVYCYELHSLRGFSRVWLRWENVDLQVEQCTIEIPPSIQDTFRPPVNCDMCANVRTVDKVVKISPETFEKMYAYSGRPVVIEDGQKNWSASETFSFSFFKNVYGEDSPVLTSFERDCQFFPYQTEFKNLREVFNMSDKRVGMEAEPWYIGWSNCDSSAANVLRQHYKRPYFLPAVAESSKTDWIFMGTPGYGAHLHIDHVGNPSWQAQIKGKKLWYLEPPPECYFDCVPMEVTVNAGEIIVLDTNIWYHSTLIVSNDLSITIGSEYD